MNNDFLDDIIKQKLNQQKYEFTSAEWSAFESKQSAANSAGTSGSNLKWYFMGAATVTLIIVASYFAFSSSSETTTQNKHQEQNNDLTDIAVETNTIDKEEITDDYSLNPTIDEINSSNSLDQNQEKNNNSSVVNSDQISAVENQNTQNPVTETVEPTNKILNNITESSNDNTNKPNESLAVKEITIPSALIMAEKLEICPGEVVSFETIEQDDVLYSWNLGDDNYSKERAIKHSYQNPGKYTVSLIVTSSKDRSILSKSKDLIIEVLPAPNTEFVIKELELEIIPSIQLITNEELANYHWDFGDGTYSSEGSPVKSYKQKGYYNVTLSSKNQDGCSSKTTHKVTIKEDYNLLAPNSFTPNGDGINDYFIPEALKLMDVEFTMSIFSKTDGLIFETKNINQQWDGRNQQNGINCSEDTYIWVVSLTNSEGKSEQYKGAVLLLK